MFNKLIALFFLLLSNCAVAKEVNVYSMFTPGTGGMLIAAEVISQLNNMQGDIQFRLTSIPGAGGDNATLRAISAARAGQDVLIWGGISGITLGRYTSPNINAYDRNNDVVQIQSFSGTPFHLAVNPNSNIKSLNDLINLFRSGKTVYFANTTTTAITPYLNVVLLKSIGFKSKDLSYTGPHEATKSILVNESDYTIFAPQDIIGLQPILSSSSEVSNIPNGKDVGISDFNFMSTVGFSVPKERVEFVKTFDIFLPKICESSNFIKLLDKIGHELRCFDGEKTKQEIDRVNKIVDRYGNDISSK
jgi:tripartite-type tricarboxylate transporter receptor subunit TctC